MIHLRAYPTFRKAMTGALLLAITVTCGAAGCDKNDGPATDAVKKLYGTYKNGEISECLHNGAKVFSAAVNAFDAETRIYDSAGQEIGACFYSTGMVDPVCNEITACEVVYRCEGHISGQPAIDKYGLGK